MLSLLSSEMNQIKESELESFQFEAGKYDDFPALDLLDITFSWGLSKHTGARQHFRSFVALLREKVEHLVKRKTVLQDNLDNSDADDPDALVLNSPDSIDSRSSQRSRISSQAPKTSFSCTNPTCSQLSRQLLTLKAEKNKLFKDLKQSEEVISNLQGQLEHLRVAAATNDDLKSYLVNLSKKQEEILEKLGDHTSLAKEDRVPAPSYASVVKLPSFPKHSPGVILSSTNSDVPVKQLEEELNKLPLKHLQLDCSRTKNGKILVKSTTSDSLSTLKESLTSIKDKVNVEDIKPRRSKVILFDAPKAPKREETEHTPLLEAYKEDFIRPTLIRYLGHSDVDFRLVRIMSSSDGFGSNLVLELEHRYAQILLQQKRLTIGFSSCNVRQYYTVNRCLNCQSFEHPTRLCQNRSFCGKCSQEHLTKNCTIPFTNSRQLYCINCHDENKEDHKNRDVHHAASSGRCPVFKKKLQSMIKQDFPKKDTTSKSLHSR